MDGFEHGVLVAHIGRTGSTHTALNLGSFVGDDIAVEVGQQHNLELLTKGLLNEVGSHDVDVVIFHFDLRIFRCDLMAQGSKLAIGLLHDICLGDDGQVLFTIVTGIFESCSCDTLGAGIGGHFKIHSHTGQINTAAAQNVLTFGVLTEEHPIDVLFRDGHRTAVCVQIQFPAHGNVCRFHGAAVRGSGGSLQNDVAGLDLRQHVIGDCLAACHTVLDGQTFDLLDDDRSGGNFIGQHLLQNTRCLSGDDGADAVTVHDTDGNSLLGGEIRLLRGHIGYSFLLLFQNLAEGLAGHINVHHYCPPSLV